MRLKFVPRAAEVIEKSKYAVKEPERFKGNWAGFFGNNNPLHVELGMGKGRFVMDMARQNPDINYIGIERQESVLLRAVEKMEEAPLPNVALVLYEGDNIEEMLGEHEIDRIYLNFSDPWPKERHAKRRLTSNRFFPRYDHVLKKDGTIEQKTDNKELFAYSLDSAVACGWKVLFQTEDLHGSPYAEGNVMTEYEERFSANGNKICKAIYGR
ncbi:MAG: tRNA (guanosine(46)-N7)-methyltransferase TrmB [Lachnospiraceae bacterium]|nr:tRNA (guanosine(46)-N7)-methyltransferase TrmB [Lachnospiraceae bacterium]